MAAERIEPDGRDDAVTSDLPLYERDPAAWRDRLAEGNRTQARKRVGADVLFRDTAGHILLVNPRYKPDWDLPGGMAEANEPPLEAAKREVKEELAIDFVGGRLLVVDWVQPHGPWDDSLMFIFDGGVLDAERQAQIKLRDGELNVYRFCPPNESVPLLRSYVWRRVEKALLPCTATRPPICTTTACLASSKAAQLTTNAESGLDRRPDDARCHDRTACPRVSHQRSGQRLLTRLAEGKAGGSRTGTRQTRSVQPSFSRIVPVVHTSPSARVDPSASTWRSSPLKHDNDRAVRARHAKRAARHLLRCQAPGPQRITGRRGVPGAQRLHSASDRGAAGDHVTAVRVAGGGLVRPAGPSAGTTVLATWQPVDAGGSTDGAVGTSP
jgi:8-oxo-dGTP pyrophosphatase MutT (NUDIX family)